MVAPSSIRRYSRAKITSIDTGAPLADTVSAAAGGDPAAWEELTDRFGDMISAIARSCRLRDADVAEVSQTTWLRLVENIDRIHHYDRLGAWLATTARRECYRLLRRATPSGLEGEPVENVPDSAAPAPEAGPIANERTTALRLAIEELPPRCQRLLGLMIGSEDRSYKQIAADLSIPIGSIGPTRSRCLAHLRRILCSSSSGRELASA